MAETDQADQTRAKRKKDHWAKLGFLAAAIVGAVLVWHFQREGPKLNWPSDLESTLSTARQEKRFVLVFFSAHPKSDAANWMIQGSLALPLVTTAIKKHEFLIAKVEVRRNLSDETAKKYGLESLPTVAILSPEGEVLEQRSGKVGAPDVVAMMKRARRPPGR